MATEVATIPQAVPGAPAAPQAGPVKGSSLWVGELSPDVTEAKLYEFFNPIAAVQSVRVCRSAVTRESLGYAYVNFQTPTDAEAAMEQRNYSELSGKVIRIMWAQRDPLARRSNIGNIVVKRLPTTTSDRELHELFKEFGNILSVKVARDTKGASKGYGFVHFDSDRAAKDAIETVNGMTVEANKAPLQVESFVARNQRQGAPDKFNNVYVKNIPKSYSEEALKSVFGAYGPITSAVITRDEEGKSKGFGFVCYADHDSAVKATEALHEKNVDTLPNLTAEDVAAANRVDSASKEDKKEGDSAKPKVKLFVGKAMKKTERERVLKEKAEAAKRERQAKFHGCNLYVRNIDDSVDDEALRKEFAPFGTIVSAKVSKETDGRSRGHGFVCFENAEAASKAQQAMNRKLVSGKPLFVALWEPKEVRTARFNANQAQQGRGRGMGPQGVAAGAAGMQGGFAANQAAMAMQAMMNPQMLMQGFLTMAMSNPQLLEQVQRMGVNGLQQFMSAYIQQMQSALARNSGMAGQAVPGVPGVSPTGAQTGARPGFNRGMGVQGVPGAFVGQSGPGSVTGQQGRGARPQRVAGQASPNVAPGAVRVAGGPGSPGARGPMQGAPVAQGARGPIAAAPRAGAPGVGLPGAPMGMAAGPRPGMPAAQAGVAPNLAYRPADGARNMPMAMVPGMQVPMGVDPAATAAAAAAMAGMVAAPQVAPVAAMSAAPAQTRENFVQQLAAITNPQQRKNMIGEHLYTQVHARNKNLAGKITGMLLDGMEDGELLNLLETPSELDSRIAEALEVLEQHKRQTGSA